MSGLLCALRTGNTFPQLFAVYGVRLITVDRALEMEVTMVGLQNAGKTSLLRVLAVSSLVGSWRVVLVSRLANRDCCAGRRVHTRVSAVPLGRRSHGRLLASRTPASLMGTLTPDLV